jgi:hypothetical protein
MQKKCWLGLQISLVPPLGWLSLWPSLTWLGLLPPSFRIAIPVSSFVDDEVVAYGVLAVRRRQVYYSATFRLLGGVPFA